MSELNLRAEDERAQHLGLNLRSVRDDVFSVYQSNQKIAGPYNLIGLHLFLNKAAGAN